MSDYIERLRGELMRAGATKPRRVRVPRAVLIPVAAAAVLVVVFFAVPRAPDREVPAGTATSHQVVGDAEGTARVLRERLPGARVEVDGQTLTITATGDVSGLLRPGRFEVRAAEQGRRDAPVLDNRAVAGARASEDPMTGEPVVLVDLTPAGEREFHTLTRAVASEGARLRELQHIAISVDDKLYSEPYIDWRVAPDGIDGAEGMHISSGFTVAQARELAAVLNSGPLPGELTNAHP